MKIHAKAGRDDVAVVYLAETGDGRMIEFAESLQPPHPREEKWVLTISTSFGCPSGCRFCEAGGDYQGRLSFQEILFQTDYLIDARFPGKRVPVKKFKIQFARMGEPSYNQNVLDVLETFHERYDAPGFIPSVSTIAPIGTDGFFRRMLEIKNRLYPERFQLQFSIHTTDETKRDWLIPAKKWSFSRIADFGKAFYQIGGRKVTLNFAVSPGMPVESRKLLQYFSPEIFLLKITPVNPTASALKNSILPFLSGADYDELARSLKEAGYEVILSIGEPEENLIGSNCGQYVTSYRKSDEKLSDGYTYPLQTIG